ncbi:MAG: hypothetical protein R3346_04735 [Candidatus Spechtbacterales bacterium]|nr:hypothetical protein [Candidatus Spechtbacterales bacterium]
MPKIQELTAEIQDSNIPVSTLLRKVKVFAEKLGQKDFLEWVNLELNGYASDSAYPEYRKISGQVKGWNPYRGWIPLHFTKKETQELISSRYIKQSVSEMEELLNSDTERFEMPFSDEVASQILADSEPKTKVSLFFDRSTITSILNQVRNRLLDWAIELDKQGLDGDEEEFTKEEKERAQTVEPKYNIESIENFHGNIGEQNNQNSQGEIVIPDESLLSKFFWYVIIALIVVIVGNVISAIILDKFFGL